MTPEERATAVAEAAFRESLLRVLGKIAEGLSDVSFSLDTIKESIDSHAMTQG